MGITRVDLEVPDLPLASRLFGELLGGRVRGGRLPGHDGWLLGRADGGASLALSQTSGARATLHRIVLGIGDLEGVATRLPAAGIAHRAEEGAILVQPGGLGAELLLTEQPASATAGGRLGAAGTTAFDHVCLAVPSLADALHLLRDVIGGDVVFGGHNAVLGTLSSQVTFGRGTRLELLQPMHERAAIAQFIRGRGPGLHHMTWHVANVAIAEAAARAAGFEVVDTDLTTREHWHETYVRPSSAMGLLVQLAWTDQHHDQPLDDAAVAAILAGRIDSYDFTMRPA